MRLRRHWLQSFLPYQIPRIRAWSTKLLTISSPTKSWNRLLGRGVDSCPAFFFDWIWPTAPKWRRNCWKIWKPLHRVDHRWSKCWRLFYWRRSKPWKTSRGSRSWLYFSDMKVFFHVFFVVFLLAFISILCVHLDTSRFTCCVNAFFYLQLLGQSWIRQHPRLPRGFWSTSPRPRRTSITVARGPWTCRRLRRRSRWKWRFWRFSWRKWSRRMMPRNRTRRTRWKRWRSCTLIPSWNRRSNYSLCALSDCGLG